jgi:dihydrofolate reductase
MPIISLVYAVSANGVIGKDGGLPWTIPSDLKHFKAVTMGKPIIMGRRTWDSLPKKPLPGRKNIVLTRDAQFKAEGGDVTGNVDAAIRLAAPADEICVIGGAEIFKAFWVQAGRIYLTRVLANVAGDTFMPEISGKDWRERERHAQVQGDKDSAPFETAIYERWP